MPDGTKRFDRFYDSVSVGAGVQRNPHIALLFTGTNFRQHQFDYRIICRDKSESDKIKEIIKKFKEAQAPAFFEDGLNIFDYPHLFRMAFSHPEYLYDFHPCALIGLNINYHRTGVSCIL